MTFLPVLTALAISSAFLFQYSMSDSLFLTIGKTRLTVLADLSIYFSTTESAMLDLPSLAVGANIISAFFIRSAARTVRRSGSPGPHPIQKSFMGYSTITEQFKFTMDRVDRQCNGR